MSITRQEEPFGSAGGLALLQDTVAKLQAMRGKQFDPNEYRQVVGCRHLGRLIAVAYQRAPVIASAAVRSYDALRVETVPQFRLLTDPPSNGGLGFDVTVVP